MSCVLPLRSTLSLSSSILWIRINRRIQSIVRTRKRGGVSIISWSSIFIEIPKFVRAGRKPFRRMTRIERWMEYFSNRLNEQEKEELAMSDKAIGDAYAAARVFFKSPEETMKYINRELATMDARSGLRAAREEGEKSGEERGEERVLKLIQLLTAQNRDDDIARIMTDKAYLQELYREFSL